MVVFCISRLGKAGIAEYCAKNQIPTVPHNTEKTKHRISLTAQIPRYLYTVSHLTVPCYRYAEYYVPIRYRGNHLP